MNNPYYNSEGYADPTAYKGIRNARKQWRVLGYESNGKRLPDLMIFADSFDEALKKARKKNINYCAGQIHENRKEFRG